MILHQIDNSVGNYNYNTRIYSGIEWKPHFHGNYELIYAVNGSTEIVVNGVRDTLFQGELVLISPYTVHSLSVDKNCKNWIGVFSEDHIISFAQKNKYTRFSKFRCSDDITKILSDHLFFEGKPDHYMLISCLYMVCNECAKNSTPISIGHGNDFITKVIGYISDNLSENISLKDISEKLNYEYHYFSSLFHDCFGMNFKSFINILRFEQACRLLGDKSLTVTDICNTCGFGSIRNFNRVFKTLYGTTPSVFRQQASTSELL